jgi:hypothetical protein
MIVLHDCHIGPPSLGFCFQPQGPIGLSSLHGCL